MNAEQVKDGIRWFVGTFGSFIAGWFAAKGWFTVDQVLSVLNSPTLLSLAATTVVFVWSLVSRSNKNLVVAANNVPEVAGIITMPTSDGRALAEAVPADTVTSAGTPAAVEIARA